MADEEILGEIEDLFSVDFISFFQKFNMQIIEINDDGFRDSCAGSGKQRPGFYNICVDFRCGWFSFGCDT